MQKYQNYKTTNIKWIDQIPADWNEIPLRKVFEDVKNSNTNGDNIRMLSLVKDIGIIPYEDRGNQGNKSSDKLEKYKIVEKGDFVINKMNAVLGSLGISEYKGLVSPVYYVLRNRNEDEFISRYFELIFKTRSVQRFLRTMSKGIMEIRESVDWAELKNMSLPLPSTEDQRSIVEYVNRVDKLTRDFIKQKQKNIELLKEYKQSKINELVTKGLDPNVKMKDSGIEWLGKIPEHWEVRRLKDLVTTITKGTTPSTLGKEIYKTGKIRFIKAENITYGEGIKDTPINYIDHETNDILSRSRLEEGDVLFVIAGATIGKVAVVQLDILPANTNQAVCIIRPIDTKLSKFLELFLQTSYIGEMIRLKSVQSAQPNISMTDISNFNISFPPLQELKLIIDEYNGISISINNQIQMLKKEIHLMKKYRQSLIYELVTGIRKP